MSWFSGTTQAGPSMPWLTRRRGHTTNLFTVTPFCSWTYFVHGPSNGESPICTGLYKTFVSQPWSEGFLSCVFSLYFCIAPKCLEPDLLRDPLFQPPTHHQHMEPLPQGTAPHSSSSPSSSALDPCFPCPIRNLSMNWSPWWALSPKGLQSASRSALAFAPQGSYPLREGTDGKGGITSSCVLFSMGALEICRGRLGGFSVNPDKIRDTCF